MAAYVFTPVAVAGGVTVRFDTASGSDTPATIYPLDYAQPIPGARLRADTTTGNLPRIESDTAILYQKTLDYRGASVTATTTLTGAAAADGTTPTATPTTAAPSATDVVLRSYVPLYRATGTGPYNFPLRLRPEEPARRSLVVRNVGTTTFTLGYTTNGNSNFGMSGSFTVTVAPGQEFFDAETVQAIHLRPAVSGDGWSAVVITELGAL